MSEYKKPLPEVQPWTIDFWKATKQHKLLIQECKSCNSKIFYPRKFCPECWSSELSWTEASGKGKIFTFTVTMTGVEKKFADDLPYVLALVDLAEGIRMMTNIVECKPDHLKIGMDVEVVFDDINDDFSLPKWRPAKN